MKAAIVRAPKQTPVYEDFAKPKPAPGERRIRILAAALSPLVKGRASGEHYSVSHPFLPLWSARMAWGASTTARGSTS
jgi:NADPH:quinone reductase-like Zn-dependent oxidoreductase